MLPTTTRERTNWLLQADSRNQTRIRRPSHQQRLRVHPEYANVKVPALALLVLYDKPYVTPGMDAESRERSELAFRILEGDDKRERIQLFTAFFRTPGTSRRRRLRSSC